LRELPEAPAIQRHVFDRSRVHHLTDRRRLSIDERRTRRDRDLLADGPDFEPRI